jgi:hypothetical protein
VIFTLRTSEVGAMIRATACFMRGIAVGVTAS